MRKQKTVELNGKPVVLESVPIGKYAEMLRLLKELPKKLGLASFDKVKFTPEVVIESLPVWISDAFPELIAILEIATPLKKEELEELSLEDITTIVLGVVEVNNYVGIFDKVKKALAQGKPGESIPATMTGSTGQ